MNSESFILLRGLIRHQIHWGPFKVFLENKLNFDCLEFLDAAGNGTEKDRRSFTKISEYVDDFRYRSLLIRQNKKPIILGISMGAMIALDWALRYPEEIKAIILINTSFGKLSPFWKRLNPSALFYFKNIIYKELEQKAFEREFEILRLVSHQKKEVKKFWAVQFSQYSITRFENCLNQLIASGRFKGSVLKPKVPVLLLGSSQDRMVDISCSLKIQECWKSPIFLHPWAGHDLTFDDPPWVWDQIQRFIDEINKKTNHFI